MKIRLLLLVEVIYLLLRLICLDLVLNMVLLEMMKLIWMAFIKNLENLWIWLRISYLKDLKFNVIRDFIIFHSYLVKVFGLIRINLKPNDRLRKVLKHGTLSIGFIGLAECLKALIGKHHGESDDAQKLGLEIIEFMRKRCDEYSAEYHLNFTLLATPAEGLSGRFVNIDKAIYGKIKGRY